MIRHVSVFRHHAKITVALALSLLPLTADAHDTSSADGTITIANMWTRATPNGAKVAGGFLTITNTGTQADRLIGGSLVTAEKVEVHEMAVADGVMKMRALTEGLEIKPGATVVLKPGSFHMMFIGLTVPVKEDDKLEGTLIFQRAGSVAMHYHATAMGTAVGKGHDHH